MVTDYIDIVLEQTEGFIASSGLLSHSNTDDRKFIYRGIYNIDWDGYSTFNVQYE